MKMEKYEALFEDESDVFGGTPQSKFWDILNTASDDLVKEQIDIFFEKFSIMENLLIEQYGEDKLAQIIEQQKLENSANVEFNKKSTYMELAGEIICRLDS
jgi:hypothetical protein